ncbi:MAG: TetR/AcrR family transcriptional regulator [Bacteroidia bacterium]
MMDVSVKILLGAQELFFKYGIKAITMDDIAKHLSMSKKTIYQYYKEKDEIVLRLVTEKIKQDECVFDKMHKEASDVIDEVFSMMKCMADSFGKINPVVFYELQKFYPEAWKKFKHFKEEFVRKSVEDSLRRGQEQEYVRKDININVLSRMRMEQVELGFNQDVFPTDKFNILDVQIAMVDHFLYGVCTLKGHKLINKVKQVKEEE